MTLRELFFSLGYEVDKSSESKVEQSIKSIKSTATKLLGAIGVGFSLAALNEISEEFTRVSDQIKNATGSLGNQAEIQQKILQSANDTRTSYEDAAEVISNLVMENQTLFGNVDEAVKFNNAATMLFKSAGKTNEQIAGLMEAINKSFAKGYVDSETMSQLLEQSPEAVALLNQRLGTTSDQLEKMASDGVMTVPGFGKHRKCRAEGSGRGQSKDSGCRMNGKACCGKGDCDCGKHHGKLPYLSIPKHVRPPIDILSRERLE